MSWSIPKKYGYGRGGEDYAEFVWNLGRCYRTPFARNEALRAYRKAQVAVTAYALPTDEERLHRAVHSHPHQAGERSMILGLDLSLTSTGWAALGPNGYIESGLIRPPATGTIGSRLSHIDGKILQLLADFGPTDIAIEHPVGRYADSTIKLAMVHGIVHRRIDWWEVTTLDLTVHDVEPTVLKKLATGRGNADKDDVRGAARNRLGYTGESDDIADAYWLCDYVARIRGWERPELPAINLTALAPKKPKKT